MAGVEFKKYSMSGAGELEVHYDSEIRARETTYHSNKNIDKNLTHLNYFIGASNYREIVSKMTEAVRKADEEHPPKRVRADRKHWFVLEATCPPELEGTAEEDRFYRMTYDLYKSILPLEGAAVHKDEKYDYYDPRKEKVVTSRNHMDMFGACINPDGRCNCKSLLTPEMCKKVNDMIQDMCLREWGISYQTGEGRTGAYKSVEQLKQESQVALQEKLAQENLEVVFKMRQEKSDLQNDIKELKVIQEANVKHINMQDNQIDGKQTTLASLDTEIAEKKKLWENIAETILKPYFGAYNRLKDAFEALRPKDKAKEEENVYDIINESNKAYEQGKLSALGKATAAMNKKSDDLEATYLTDVSDDDDFEHGL